MEIICEHIAANCNPMAQTLEFIDGHSIAYCFKNQVGIYDIKSNNVVMNINNRSINPNRANCLKIINSGEKVLLIVGYDSGHCCIFEQKGEVEWSLIETIQQDNAIMFFHSCNDYLITGNANSEINVYWIQ